MPRLIVDKGPDRSRSVPLDAGAKLVVGRDQSCDFVLNDQSLSRRHFAVVEKDGNYYVRDLKSTHGTLVNGWSVDTAALQDGDAISAGETVFSFVAESNESGRGLVGKNVAGYQVIERIGRGGMGTVFRAKQVALDRDVALKVLSRRYSSDKTFVNRFFKEAQAAARLNHPNVVQIYDVREEKGLYLISMEMMSGGTVEDRVSHEGALPIRDVVKIARDAAQGLVYAEKKGIVHRDIKPDNLMLNGEGTVKISDLGLARDASTEVGQEGEEGIFGTPHFIAPEQALGKPVDSRTDIYSLGASLYRLVTGETPFKGASVGEIIRQQIHDEPRDPREIREECPADLADLIAVMMAKDPAERFENAEALAAAIGALSETGRLEGAGGGLGKKLAFAAIGLVVIGAGAFFAFGGKDDPVRPDPDPPKTTENETDPEADAAARAKREAEQRELEVTSRFLAAREFGLGLAGAGRLEDPAALDELATKYEHAVEAGPDTEKAAEARAEAAALREKAKALRQAAADAEAAAEAERQRIETAWTELQAEVTRLEGESRYAAAIAAAIAREEALKGTEREAARQQLLTEIPLRAEAHAREEEADALRDVAAGGFDAARERVDALIASYSEGLGEGIAFEGIRKLIGAARQRRVEIDELESAKRRADLADDRRAVFAFLRDHYEKLRGPFDLDERNAAVARIEKELKTDRYRGRIAELRTSLEPLGRLRKALATRAADPEAKRLTVSTSAKVLPRGNVVEADGNGVTIEDRRGKRETARWSQVPLEEAVRYLFGRMDRSPAESLDLATVCLEAGLIEAAQESLEALDEDGLGELESRAAELRTEVAREAQARAKLDEIRALYAAAKGGDSAAWFPLRREVQDFFENFRDTRVLVGASDGSRYFPER